MRGFLPILLLGSLALASNSGDSSNKGTENSSETVLGGIFPSENVPKKSQVKDSTPTSTEKSSDSKSANSNDQQVITQLSLPLDGNKGRIFAYQIPLNASESSIESSEFRASPEDFIPLQYDKPSSKERYFSGEEKYLGNPVKKSGIKKKKPYLKEKGNLRGNETLTIQGAGTGLFQVSQPQPFDQPLVFHEAQPEHQFNQHQHQPQLHNLNNFQQEQIPIHAHQELYNGHGQHPQQLEYSTLRQQPIHGEPLAVYNAGVEEHQFQGPHAHQQLAPHPHFHHPEPHHHHHDFAKPLKPSIVHRDPHDSYYTNDKIRTLDKDHEHEHKSENYGKGVHPHYQHGPHYPGPVAGIYQVDHKGFEPYNYDMKKLPECAHKNKHFYNLTFCLEDHLYPLETIIWALEHYGHFAHKLLSDVTYQSADNLVTGLTRAEEEGYTYKHYFGASHSQHLNLEKYKPPYNGYAYDTSYYKHGGYICPSDIYYARPRRAMNTYGEWKVIVNVDHVPKPHHVPLGQEHGGYKKREAHPYHSKGHDLHKKSYTQTLRLEQCIYPNAPCSYISPQFHSTCIQKHNFVRLVAWTHEEGLHVDTFKMPIACSCHIPHVPVPFFHEHGRQIERHGSVVPPINNYIH